MKKFNLFATLLFLTFAAYSQQQELIPSERQLQHERRADSSIASQDIKQIKKFITITSEQEAALSEASAKASQAKRNVFKNYWKIGSFEKEMAKADYLKDSLYLSILGQTSYARFRDKRDADLQQRRQELRARVEKYKDSLSTKPRQHEK